MVRLEVLRACLDRLDGGSTPVLCTVVRTRGSSPARVGARMVVGGGPVLGSVGGSEMERQVIEKAGAVSPEGAVLTYDLQHRKLGALDLACGGAVDVLVEPIVAAKRPIVEAWLDAMQSRRPNRTVTVLDPAPRGLVLKGPAGADLLVEDHPPRPHVLLVGGGHINLAVAQMLDPLEYFYSVVDSRSGFAAEDRFPRARALHAEEPGTFLERGGAEETTHVLICSHAQRSDFDATRALLKGGYEGWIGLIGSRSKRKDFEGRLAGLPFEKVAIPVGLRIGAADVNEIAVSIVAQIVEQVRRPRA